MCSLAGKNFTGSVLPVSAKCLVKRLFQRPRPTGRSNPKGAGARWRLDQLAWAGMCALSSCCSRCGGGGNFTLPTLIFCSCLQDGLCHTLPPRLRGDVYTSIKEIQITGKLYLRFVYHRSCFCIAISFAQNRHGGSQMFFSGLVALVKGHIF